MARIDENRMFEVRVVRKRHGRERKHKVWSYMVVARSEREARALIGATGYDTIVRVAAMTTAMSLGKVDSLTDDEFAVTRTEGYEAMQAERHERLMKRIKAEIILAEARNTGVARQRAAEYGVARTALADTEKFTEVLA